MTRWFLYNDRYMPMWVDVIGNHRSKLLDNLVQYKSMIEQMNFLLVAKLKVRISGIVKVRKLKLLTGSSTLLILYFKFWSCFKFLGVFLESISTVLDWTLSELYRFFGSLLDNFSSKLCKISLDIPVNGWVSVFAFPWTTGLTSNGLQSL